MKPTLTQAFDLFVAGYYSFMLAFSITMNGWTEFTALYVLILVYAFDSLARSVLIFKLKTSLIRLRKLLWYYGEVVDEPPQS